MATAISKGGKLVYVEPVKEKWNEVEDSKSDVKKEMKKVMKKGKSKKSC